MAFGRLYLDDGQTFNFKNDGFAEFELDFSGNILSSIKKSGLTYDVPTEKVVS